jgi:DNA repair exonuclease SbcCD ATPase subunit
MRKVELAAIEIEHFRSYRTRQRITFSERAGLYYLSGWNKVEPRLQSNGAGKSSLWGALTWCLYGSTDDGDRANDVVSWTEERPTVIAYLYINNQLFDIERQGSPNRLSINGKEAEQADLNILLGLDRSRFLQSVLYGQFAPLFMELSVNERGDLLDEILSLDYWIERSDMADARVKQLNTEAVALGKELARLQGAMEALADETSLRKSAAEWEENHRRILVEAIEAVADAEQEEANTKQQLAELKQQSPACAEFRAEDNGEINRLSSLISVSEHRSRELDDMADFYRQHRNCPTCHQPLTEAFVKEALNDILLESTRLKADRVIQRADLDDLRKAAEAGRQVREAEAVKARTHTLEVRGLEHRLESLSREIGRLIQQAERVGADRDNPFLAQLEERRLAREVMEQDKRRLNRSLLAKKSETEKAEFWKAGFKRIRLFCIKQRMQSLELEVVAAAAALGLVGWKIGFTTETETRRGTLKHGVQVRVQSPHSQGAWSKWSGGEGQRIKLSVSIGLSNLIQRMAGVWYGFEIWDEPIQHLSPQGVEDLLTALDYRAQVTDKQVWVVDPTATTYAGFDEIWQAVKDEHGTHIERL